MYYFLKTLLLFALFIVLLYPITIFVSGEYLPQGFLFRVNYRGCNGHMLTRLSEVIDYKNIDILFIGSSHAYRGFDTRIFKEHKINTFNLGSSQQTPLQTEFLLKRYLGGLNPKIIIYEIYPNTFADAGIESALDIISNTKIDKNLIRMSLNLNNIKVYNSLMFGLLRDFIRAGFNYSEDIQKGKDRYVSGGFVERELMYYKIEKLTKRKWEPNQNQINKFIEALNIIKESNSKLILVYAPITSSLYDTYSNNDEFDDFIGKYGTYYNFNQILDLDDSIHFYDNNHLNQKGVEIFNRKLIEILVNNKELINDK